MHKYKEFIENFNFRYNEFIDQKINTYQKLSSQKLESYFLAIKNITQSGKRVRPYIAWLCLNSDLNDLPEESWQTLMAIESIHSFALIHDDVMDQSATRRGQPTIHESIKQDLLSKNSKQAKFNAEMLAILIGDVVFWQAFELVTKNSANREKVNQIFIKLIESVVTGQMLDVFQTTQSVANFEDVVLKTKQKTAYYTFSYPMQIGATLRNASELEMNDLFEIGEKIGLAFQIQDDLLDIIGDPKITQKPILNDIVAGQHTILSSHFFNNGSKNQVDKVLAFWQRPLSEEAIATIPKLFEETGTLEYAKQEVALNYQEAKTLINNSSNIEIGTKEKLLGLIEYLEKREK